MADRRYPIQGGPSVPWEFMVPHEAQHKANHGGQTLERMAQRGGLGATEAWCCVNGLKLWPAHDTDEGIEKARKGWFELAERVNREWSFKQTRAEVLAACIAHFEKDAERCAECADGETGEARAAWNRAERLYEECVDDLRKLQPAAKALEELLREAELKAVKSSPECWHYNTETDQEFMERYFSWRKNRIAKLEKARAILVKG